MEMLNETISEWVNGLGLENDGMIPLPESEPKDERGAERRWRYDGSPMLTRGDCGVWVSGGRSYGDDTRIYSFDPDFGDFEVGVTGDLDWFMILDKGERIRIVQYNAHSNSAHIANFVRDQIHMRFVENVTPGSATRLVRVANNQASVHATIAGWDATFVKKGTSAWPRHREDEMNWIEIDMFCQLACPGRGAAEICTMSLENVTESVNRERNREPDNIDLSDREIALIVLGYMRERSMRERSQA